MKHKTRTKTLSIMLSLVLMLSLLPGMGLTAYAAPTETLLTTITGAGSNTNPATSANVSYSTEGVATLTFSEPTSDGNVAYQASPAWGWWGYDMTLTVTPAEGYTITKCVFYDDKDRTATDSEAPFVVETTKEDKTPKVNGTPILADTSKGITKIEVYGYATPAHTHDFTYSASRATITATCSDTSCALHSSPATLTLSAIDTTYTGSAYTGASLTDTTAWTGAGLTAPTIEYAGRGSTSYTKSTTAPTNAGTYTASITVDTDKTATADFTINPMALTITGATATNRTYDKDSTAVTISAVTFKDSSQQAVALTVGEDKDYTVTGAMSDANAGDGKNVNVTVTLKNANYSLATNTTTATVNIGKADAQTIADVTDTLLYTATSVSESVAGKMPDDAGTLTYSAGSASKTGSVTVSNFDVNATSGAVTATLSGGAAGDTVTLPVTIGSTNYADSTVNVKITLTAKSDAGVDITGVPASKTYGDADFTLTGNVTNEGTGTGNWTWSTSNETVFQITPNGATATVKILKAGSATVTAKYESDTTIDTETTAAITVNTKTLRITAKDQSIYVGGTVPTLSGSDFYTVTGLVGEDTLTTAPTLAYQKDGSAATPDNTAAGTYDIVASGASAGDNYAISYTKGTLTISEKQPATVTKAPTANTLTYNGQAQELVTAGTATGGEMQYALGTKDAATEPYTTSIPTATDAGTYYVWYKVPDTENYNGTDPEKVSVTIDPAAVTLTANSGTETYDGDEKTVTGYTCSVEGLTFAETVTASGKGENVGAYEVTFSGVKLNETKDSTGNYVVKETFGGKLTINKANSAVATAPTAKSLTYTGEAQELITAGSGEGGTIKYAVTADETEPSDEAYTFTNESLPTGIEAKTYYVWYRVFADANHFDSAAAHIAVSIKGAEAGNTAPTADKLVYNGEAQALVKPGSATGGTLQYALGDSGETAPADGWSENVPQGTDAGTYHVWYRVLGDANHNDVPPACVDVEIAKAAIAPTVSITGWTYGEATNAPSVTGNTGGGAVTYAYSDKADGTFAEAVPTNVGTWYVKATVAETANYLGATTDAASFAIARATATVTANSASKTAGDNDPLLTATVTGLVNGDAASVITYTVTRAAGEEAGTYAITPKGEKTQGNYAVTYVEGTLTIAARPEPQPVQDEGDYSFEVEEQPGAPKVEAEKLPEAETNKLMTEAEKQLKEAGASVNVTVETTPLSEGSVPERDKNLIALTAKDMDGNVIVGPYIDISMYMKVGDGTPRQVTELNGATLRMKVEIPKEYLNGQYTDFAIIQTHDGGKTQVHSKRVGDAIELELTELCTFALVYREVKAEPEPQPEPLPEGLLLAKMTSTGKTSLKLTWTEMKGAEGYDVFFSLCNNGKETRELKLEGTVKAGKSLKNTFKDLKKARCYKACVKAWVKRDGEKVYVSQSPVVHCLTNNQSTNTTNAKSVKLNKSKLTLTEGGKATLRMTVKVQVKGKSLLDHGDKYRFYSSDTTVATVKNDGTVKAVGEGTCEIYAMAANGERASCKVTVVPAPEGVSFKKQGYEVKKGKTLNLAKQVKLNPTNAKTTYTWTSSDKRIAKVNSKGEVKGVKKGTATITVKTANGKKASVTVTVK